VYIQYNNIGKLYVCILSHFCSNAIATGIPRDIYIIKGPQGYGFAMRGIKGTVCMYVCLYSCM